MRPRLWILHAVEAGKGPSGSSLSVPAHGSSTASFCWGPTPGRQSAHAGKFFQEDSVVASKQTSWPAGSVWHLLPSLHTLLSPITTQGSSSHTPASVHRHLQTPGEACHTPSGVLPQDFILNPEQHLAGDCDSIKCQSPFTVIPTFLLFS